MMKHTNKNFLVPVLALGLAFSSSAMAQDPSCEGLSDMKCRIYNASNGLHKANREYEAEVRRGEQLREEAAALHKEGEALDRDLTNLGKEGVQLDTALTEQRKMHQREQEELDNMNIITEKLKKGEALTSQQVLLLKEWGLTL